MGDIILGAFGARVAPRTRSPAWIAVEVRVDDDAFTAVLRETPDVGPAIGIDGLALMVTDVEDGAGGRAIVTCERIRLSRKRSSGLCVCPSPGGVRRSW
jgi:hypothetical protein